ncbi:hypothetical protein [Haliscomenobacter hydrossis]|uniref:HNH endonuclease n=1 Tax=Haliscomenobacter hydrossis (strain ATCC 27775 / DSM 1100 / LMG 10767 / O) TaxID=760192 RepID=F4L2S9_HALH1|nr:hypothetical protein [Haliscomenobacter hydrossis]AEE48643.1 hypothetical protein Halhy_0735 [Haliscomenobacter hydrossis DSM 1100]
MIKIQTKRPISLIAQEHLDMAKGQSKGDVYGKLKAKIAQGMPSDKLAFLKFLESKFETILIGNPHELNSLIEESQAYSAYKTETGGLKETLKKIFNYEKFSEKGENLWNTYWLADQLRVDTCPYCNRLYTHTVIKEKEISRPQFDHFWDQATYPFLALSFYNLIPSCYICNSTLKRNLPFSTDTHIHPYIEGFGDEIRFTLKIKDSSFFSGNLKAGSIDFLFVDEESELAIKAKKNIRDFKLREMYEEHIDYVYEQVNRALIYNRDYLDSLYQQFEGTLFRNEKDLSRFITANYVDDAELQKRPLSKLTKDISHQFGLD